MTTTTVMPTVAAPRPRIESVPGMGLTQPLSWHGVDVRTGNPSLGIAGFVGRVASVVPSTRSTDAFAGRVDNDARTTAKQPHPPRGVPR